MNEYFLLFGVIIALSLVQSFMGVGILLFGTPTLLLLGYTYVDTLALILPSSVFISALQTYYGFEHIKNKQNVLIYTLPFLIVGLTLIILFEVSLDLKKIVGIMLILVGLIRLSNVIKNFLSAFILKHKKIYCMIMGAVHGVSNMGGGMLVLLMNSEYKTHKEFRTNVAFVYLLFGVVQLSILLFISPSSMVVMSFFLSLVAGVIYQISMKFFKKYVDVDEKACQQFITFFIFLYGIISFL